MEKGREKKENGVRSEIPNQDQYRVGNGVWQDTGEIMEGEIIEETMKEEQDRIRLEMDSLSRNEEFARVVVSVFMSRMNPTLEEMDDVKTAVSEAVTNAIIHGYRSRPGIVYIEAMISGNELSLSIEDRGTGIPDIKKAMEPMYTSDKTGERSGMGFSFMEAFMDWLEVESQPGKGTVVRMKKRIGG